MRVFLLLGVSTLVLAAGPPQLVTRPILPLARPAKLITPLAVTPVSVPEIVVRPGSPNPATSRQARLPAATIEETVEQIASERALPAALIHSMIKVESNYNASAVSSKGARGLMQLVPATARRFGVSDIFNARENIDAGVNYFKHLLELYHGNYPLALSAYNAGESAVARYGGIPPFPETQAYLIRVWKELEKRSKTPRGEKEEKQ